MFIFVIRACVRMLAHPSASSGAHHAHTDVRRVRISLVPCVWGTHKNARPKGGRRRYKKREKKTRRAATTPTGTWRAYSLRCAQWHFRRFRHERAPSSASICCVVVNIYVVSRVRSVCLLYHLFDFNRMSTSVLHTETFCIYISR